MATEKDPTRSHKKILITGDGEYQEEFISRKVIQTQELKILEAVFSKKDYLKALFFPDKADIILIAASVLSLWILRNFISINMHHPSALIFTGIFGIFFYTTRFAYFSVTDLFMRIAKTQDPHRLIDELDFDINFWGLLFNLTLIGIGSYLTG